MVKTYLLIKDIQTGKSLQILGEPFDTNYTIIKDILEITNVKERSIEKVIRNWMKEIIRGEK